MVLIFACNNSYCVWIGKALGQAMTKMEAVAQKVFLREPALSQETFHVLSSFNLHLLTFTFALQAGCSTMNILKFICYEISRENSI